MKRKLTIVFMLAICILLCVTAFVACNLNPAPKHTHNYVWVDNGDGTHKQHCNALGCDEPDINTGSHDYGSGNACVCGSKKPVPVESVTLNKSVVNLVVGETLTLTVEILPADATEKDVVFTSDNPKVADVDNLGKVTALSDGTAVITVAVENKSAVCTVTVSKPAIRVTSVTLNRTYAELEIGQTFTLTAEIVPADATDKSLGFTSSNPSAVSIDDDGKLTAIAEGTAVITATADGKSAECTVKVFSPITNAQLIEALNKDCKQAMVEKCLVVIEINADNITDSKWYVNKDNDGNITSVQYTGSYKQSTASTWFVAGTATFASPISAKDLKEGKIGNVTYNRDYIFNYDSTIQAEHQELTDAICDKLFGTAEGATRFIKVGAIGSDTELNSRVREFTVVQIVNGQIQETSLFIKESTTDSEYINKLKDYSNYRITNTKSHTINGDKLEAEAETNATTYNYQALSSNYIILW